MKLTVNEEGCICLEELFNGIELKSTSGESIGICMRDGGFEMKVDDRWYIINNGKIKMMTIGKMIVEDHETSLKASKILLAQLEKINSYAMVETSELKQLREDSDKLKKLEAAGVDNWDGYDEALQ